MSAPAVCRLRGSASTPLHARSEITERERQRGRKITARFCLDMARAPAPLHREILAKESGAAAPARAAAGTPRRRLSRTGTG